MAYYMIIIVYLPFYTYMTMLLCPFTDIGFLSCLLGKLNVITVTVGGCGLCRRLYKHFNR